MYCTVCIVVLQGISALPKTPRPVKTSSAKVSSPPPIVRPGMIKTAKGSAAAFSSQYAQYLASMVAKPTQPAMITSATKESGVKESVIDMEGRCHNLS